jgi:hypothetical protein
MLALERKEASKVNLKNVMLEQELRQLEQEKEVWNANKEKLMK